MDFINELEKEHEEIEIELRELELIMQDEDINYSNLHHTFSKLCKVWDAHESKEERIFPVMKKERVIVPVSVMQCGHRELRPHKIAIDKAIASGSQTQMRKALDEHGTAMIELFRKHMGDEENILFSITSEIFTPEEIGEIEDNIR